MVHGQQVIEPCIHSKHRSARVDVNTAHTDHHALNRITTHSHTKTHTNNSADGVGSSR